MYGVIRSVSLLIMAVAIASVIEFLRCWAVLRKTGLKKRGISSTNRITLNIAGSTDQAWSLCEEAVQLFKNGTIAQTNKKKGELSIYTKFSSLSTWKDNIRFELHASDEHHVKITITSWPEKYEPLDFGRNLKNIIAIVNYLREKTHLSVLRENTNIYSTKGVTKC